MSDIQGHIERAYGLLWHVTIDTGTSQGRLVSDARKALLEVLTHEERGAGIAAAKEWISNHPKSGYSAPFYQSAMTDRTPMQRALDAEALVADLAKRVAKLEAALKPFAYGNIDVSGAAVILGYPECEEALRVARDALAGKGAE